MDVGGVLEVALENGSFDTSEILANGLPVPPSCFDSGDYISDAMFTVKAELNEEVGGLVVAFPLLEFQPQSDDLVS